MCRVPRRPAPRHESDSGNSPGEHLAVRYYWNLEYRSEEHTSELQSHSDIVCRLLLEKRRSHPGTPTSSTACPTSSTTASAPSSRQSRVHSAPFRSVIDSRGRRGRGRRRGQPLSVLS